MKERPKDDFEKKYRVTLDAYVDRWLIGSQWSGRWAESSNRAMASYVNALNSDWVAVKAGKDLDLVHKALEARLNALVADITDDATTYVAGVTAPSRERVSVYRNVLWVWHRLEKERWKMSQIQLRTGRSKKTSLDVDHTVSYALWEKMLIAGLPDGFREQEESQAIVNRLGNCSLLEKSFNVSKSDKTLKSFMEAVHDIKEKKVVLKDWAKTLMIEDAMLDPSGATVNTISKAIEERDQLICKEVADFVKGTRRRVDLGNP